MINRITTWMALALSFGIVAGGAQEESGQPNSAARQWVQGLKFETGEVSIGNGVAKATVPANYKYLNPADSAKYLELLGNPPSKVLGILFPAQSNLLDTNPWFAVLEYEREGHVKDDDAAKIDYTALLANMQKSSKEDNEARAKKGFPKVDLIGWASTPRYDSSAHKLYWAKDLRFEGESGNTLNYNIRMLGREGVLVANVVAGLENLSTVEQATPDLLAMIDFTQGNRYQDYNSKTDHTAEYGIAGLIAGAAGLKIAAKAGIFALILKKAAVLWKPIAIGFAVVAAKFRKFFGKRDEA